MNSQKHVEFNPVKTLGDLRQIVDSTSEIDSESKVVFHEDRDESDRKRVQVLVVTIKGEDRTDL